MRKSPLTTASPALVISLLALFVALHRERGPAGGNGREGRDRATGPQGPAGPCGATGGTGPQGPGAISIIRGVTQDEGRDHVLFSLDVAVYRAEAGA